MGCSEESKVNTIENEIQNRTKLVEGKCTKPEMLNRTLLQQTWFHSDKFIKVGIVFDQTSFTYYKNTDNSTEKRIEGAFCINGKDLIVRYYKVDYVPSKIDFKSTNTTISFSRKIRPLNEGGITVIELTKKIMTLKFNGEDGTHTFYRRH